MAERKDRRGGLVLRQELRDGRGIVEDKGGGGGKERWGRAMGKVKMKSMIGCYADLEGSEADSGTREQQPNQPLWSLLVDMDREVGLAGAATEVEADVRECERWLVAGVRNAGDGHSPAKTAKVVDGRSAWLRSVRPGVAGRGRGCSDRGGGGVVEVVASVQHAHAASLVRGHRDVTMASLLDSEAAQPGSREGEEGRTWQGSGGSGQDGCRTAGRKEGPLDSSPLTPPGGEIQSQAYRRTHVRWD
ncbi:hypothetical protein Pcinc_005231 [Petrolisthes cinctipes]|uniref:Uncharacterized protein n=1 Tax=Petrolisthes cinctipes TaxID=88211 RepID=A0AAE1L2Y8_PETCI|nr:hypothetical protein Pcinc_005231 [Petrolisthes cinctipes]